MFLKEQRATWRYDKENNAVFFSFDPQSRILLANLPSSYFAVYLGSEHFWITNKQSKGVLTDQLYYENY